MALTKLDPNVIGQDSTGAGKITSAGGSVSIDSSGNVRIANSSANSIIVTANGSIGIGTQAPSYTLEVQKTVDSDWMSRVYNTSANGYGLLVRSDATTGANTVVFGAYAASAYQLAVRSNGTTGIGTTTPASKLHVHKSAANDAVMTLSGAAGSGAYVGLRFGYADSGAYDKGGIFFKNTDGAWARGELHFALDSAADAGNADVTDSKMVINNAGNVGIGTDSPSYKLHVAGEVYAGGNQEFVGKYFHTTSKYYSHNTAARTLFTVSGAAVFNVKAWSSHNSGGNYSEYSIVWSPTSKAMSTIHTNQAYAPGYLGMSLNTSTGAVSVASNPYGVDWSILVTVIGQGSPTAGIVTWA